MAFEREFIKNIPDKSLSPIYENLINLCLMFTYNSSEKFCCDQFKGCLMKPLSSWLDGERNYCFICRMTIDCNIYKIDYNIYKIYKITGIIDMINVYRKLMEDLQLCIEFSYINFWVYSFKTKKEIKKKTNLIKLIHDI